LSNRRSHLVLVAALLIALAGVALLAIPGSPTHKKTTLGLDLQGGLEVVLKAVPPPGHKLTQQDLNRSVSIMRQRVDKLGVSEPEIRKQGTDQIVIQLAGVHDPQTAAKVIGTTAQLQLFDLETAVTGPSSVDAQGNVTATTNLFDLLAGQQARIKDGNATAWYLFSAKKKLLAGPKTGKTIGDEAGAKAKLLQKFGGKLPKGAKVFGVPTDREVVSCGTQQVICPPGITPTRTYYYLFKYTPNDSNLASRFPQMKGSDLKLSGTQADIATDTGQPEVLMQFTSKGGKKFHDITRDEVNRGRSLNNPQHFAIVLDNQIQSFPQLDYTDPSLSDGIDPINGARITGLKNMNEAKSIATVLQTGALPVNFTQIENTQVSATLGKDSLQQAKRAAIGGLIVVMILLLLLYRFMGVVAIVGLGIYAAFLYAAILIFNVTLTLPGFAGIVLTVGVAADANVVIFERIKEEVRTGKSVRAAVSAGYAKGFHTIVDANVVTCITALVLFAVATAEVKGFALMLLIGTVISLITAVAATRAMLGLLAGFRWFENPKFMGASGAQRGRFLQIDFMGRRYLWLAISGVVILVSAVSLGVRGLNLGIDFKGGTQISFKTAAPTSLDSIRNDMKAIGEGDAVIQGRGASFNGGGDYKSFQIRTKSLSEARQGAVQDALQNKAHATSLGTKNVSSSFGRQIARSAILAILFSIFLIIGYIAVRFHGIKFAVPVIAALLHDLLITVGVYSLTGREVSNATVAAVLTVLGYSIYDTIIIFDRIRENIPLMRRQPFATIANVSLWETIRRSIATTVITLLPVVSLYLFGGATLQDFAFALLVGITSGAYSSIFIAAPLLTMWKEREPEFARRKATVPTPTTEAAADAILAEAEEAAAEEPAPELVATTPAPAPAPEPSARQQEKRDRRRQRRSSRPHGRAR
jgi:SecD/SecF fusion protein